MQRRETEVVPLKRIKPKWTLEMKNAIYTQYVIKTLDTEKEKWAYIYTNKNDLKCSTQINKTEGPI